MIGGLSILSSLFIISKTISCVGMLLRHVVRMLVSLVLILSTFEFLISSVSRERSAIRPREFNPLERVITDEIASLIASASRAERITITPQVVPSTRLHLERIVRFPIVTAASLSEYDRRWLVGLCLNENWSQRSLCTFFEGLSHSALQRWVKQFQAGEPTKVDIGRPSKLSKEQLDMLEVELNGYGYRKGATGNQAHDLLVKMSHDNYSRRHPEATATDVFVKGSLSRATEDRYYDELRFNEREAKHVSDARRRACESLRHTYSLAVGLMAFSFDSPSVCKINGDATAITIGFNQLKGHTVMVPSVLREEDRHQNLRPEVYDASEMDLIVKLMHLSSASGDTDGMVIIIQDKSIAVGEFFCFNLRHFTCPTSLATPGSTTTSCIYFCRSRAGNPSMWQHWLTKRVAPFCVNVRQSMSEEYDDLITWFSTDGEAVIMNEGLTDAVAECFEANNIVYGRIPAATTSIHQPCDRSLFFRLLNSAVSSDPIMRQFNDRQKVGTNDLLESEIARVMTYSNENGSKPTAEFVRKVTRACIFLEFVLGKTLQKADVMNSFTVCGQHQLADPVTGATVNFRKVMQQCHQAIDEPTMANLEHHLAFFVDQMTTTGQLSWKDMDERKISDEDVLLNRDTLSFTRHACEILSHENTRKRKREWDQDRNPAVVKARRLIAKTAEDDAKAAAKKLEKEQQDAAKAEAKEAKDQMSPAQKQELAAQKRLVTATNKRRREAEAQQELDARNQQVATANALLVARGLPLVAATVKVKRAAAIAAP